MSDVTVQMRAQDPGWVMLRLSVATLLLFLVLIQPNHPQAMTWGALRLFPLELPVILAGLVALGPGWAGRVGRGLLVVALVALVVIKLADFVTFIAFNRGFNLVTDYNLVPAAFGLAQGSLGPVLVWIALITVPVMLLILAVALWWATGVWSHLTSDVPLRLPAGTRLRRGAGLLVIPLAAVAVVEIGKARGAWSVPAPVAEWIPGAAFTARVGVERVAQVRDTRADLAHFRAAAESDPMSRASPLFDLLGDRDLILVYVESYGRSSFDNPLYRPTHVGTLREIEADLAARGLAMRSGWSRAPMVGGQSWLAHGSVASGMWLDTQGRYRALLSSTRRTLLHYAQEHGLRTVAVKPAHVLPWPEGDYFGFDAIYNAADLGYQGEPFNWVTMPDQFTMTALDRLERGAAQGTRTPILAQVALVSSHAPWTPIPPLIDWDEVGDGSIFSQWANEGDPPEVVWRDHDRVRDQFRQAVDYSLQVIGSWAARHAEDPPLLIMLGDHEPAGFVAGVPGADVPIHVIGPEDLVARFADLGWSEGMVPDPDLAVIPMDALRDTLLRALGSGAP